MEAPFIVIIMSPECRRRISLIKKRNFKDLGVLDENKRAHEIWWGIHSISNALYDL